MKHQDPRNPRPGPAGDPHEPHHGLAEEIRDEVRELAAHVPRPVRWTVRKLVLLVGVCLLGLLAVGLATAALYIANRTEWAAQELALIANRYLAARSELRLELADLKGNLVTGARMIEPRLVFPGRDRPPFFAAREVRLRYPFLDVVWGRHGPIHIEADGAALRVERGPAGELRWPGWKAGPALPSRRTTRLQIRLRDAKAWLGSPEWSAEGLDLEASGTLGSATRIELRALRCRRAPYGARVERGAATVELSDSLRFRIRELVLDQLRQLRGEGAFARSGDAGGEARFTLQDLRFRWLARIFRNRTFDVPGGLGAELRLRRSQGLRADFSARALWDDLPVSGTGTVLAGGGGVVVSPLRGSSPAGELDGALRWTREGWSLGGNARRADPAHWGALGLRAWPAGQLQGRFLYSVDTRRGVPDARLEASLGSGVLANWRADSGRVTVWMRPQAPDSFLVDAHRRGGRFLLEGRTEDRGWQGRFAVRDFPLEEWPEAHGLGLTGRAAAGGGRLEGRSGTLGIAAGLHGAALEWSGTRARGWALDSIAGTLLPRPDLAGHARLSGVTFLGVRLDSVSAPYRLVGDTLALPAVNAAAADTSFAASGAVRWDRSGWHARLARFEAASPRFAWRSPSELRLRGDPRGVEFEAFRLEDGPASLDLEGCWAGPGGHYDWRARLREFDLARSGLPAETGASGRGAADLRVWGPFETPGWSFEGRVREGRWQGRSCDSLALGLAGAPGELETRVAHLWLGRGRLTLQGSAREMERQGPGGLDPERVRAWILSAREWQGTLRAEDLPLDGVARLEPSAGGVRGRLSGGLEWSGSPRDPELKLTAAADSVGWRDFEVDRLEAEASFRDGRLRVGRCELGRGGTESHVLGSLPLRMDLQAGRLWLPDEALELRASLPGGDLGVVPLFVPQVASASGAFALEAVLTGTVEHPDLSGKARVRDGRVRLTGREEVLEGLHADFTLDEARITLDSLGARQGERGRVAANGEVRLQGLRLLDYRFQLELHGFRAQETGVYAADLDGHLLVQKGPRRNGATLPSVTGRVSLRRAAVLFDFANQSEVQQLAASTRPLDWVYSVELEAESALRWRPPDADIEFSAGLSVEQTLDSLLIYGEVRALRGDYFFLGNRFRVDRAVLGFDNVGGVDPQLDIVATTQVPRSVIAASRGGVQGAAEPGTVEVTASITGRASNPVIRFSGTDEGVDETAILGALGFQQFQQGEARAAALENYLTRMLSRQLSEQLSGVFGGYVRDWEVSRDPSGALKLGVGTQLTRELRVRYQQALPGYTAVGLARTNQGLFERDVEAEYRLNRFVYLTTGIAQRRVSSSLVGESSTTTDFNVNLKVRLEY